MPDNSGYRNLNPYANGYGYTFSNTDVKCNTYVDGNLCERK
jgi:hypothetical protein